MGVGTTMEAEGSGMYSGISIMGRRATGERVNEGNSKDSIHTRVCSSIERGSNRGRILNNGRFDTGVFLVSPILGPDCMDTIVSVERRNRTHICVPVTVGWGGSCILKRSRGIGRQMWVFVRSSDGGSHQVLSG